MRRSGAQHPLRTVPTVTVIEPPAPLVTVAEIDTRLRLGLNFESPVSDEDQAASDDVEAMIAAATAMLDGPTGNLGRAIGPQTLELSTEGTGQTYIELPYPPFIELVEVATIGDDGERTTVDPTTYAVRRGAAYFSGGAPTTPDLRIRYRAGYVTATSPEEVATPKNLKAAIILLVGDMWAFRETATLGQAMAIPMSPTVQALTAPFKVFAI